MLKGLIIQQNPVVEENMSNLTSTSGEGIVSSGSRGEGGSNMYPQQSFASPVQQTTSSTPAVKKKRNLPGNPDPDAEVIALSPKTLMATNRFVCEICNKGFQRDQNLQLHRRGHNLPWKLKQRTSKEVRKRVYVCPEPSCVHHDPSRALGDLTGIKKHFCRKHGEKKWKCEKCSKRYAVQSDWKAHSKTCGTREYRCDCGTLFSRRDSFITHRAFCDALAEESARAMTTSNPVLHHHPGSTSTSHLNLQSQFIDRTHHQDHHLQAISSFKREPHQQQLNLRPELPPWLACNSILGAAAGPGPPHHLDHHHHLSTSSSIFSSARSAGLMLEQEFPVHSQASLTTTHPENSNSSSNQQLNINISNNNNNLAPYNHHHPSASSAHMSATALLQKAAQMGATMSKPCSSSSATTLRPHHHAHMSAGAAAAGTGTGAGTGGPPSILQDMMMTSLSSSPGAAVGFDPIGTSFEEAFRGMLQNSSSKRSSDENPNINNEINLSKSTKTARNDDHQGGGIGNNEGLTRDFLGLRAFPSHREILTIAGLERCMSSSSPYDDHHHHQQHRSSDKQWQG